MAVLDCTSASCGRGVSLIGRVYRMPSQDRVALGSCAEILEMLLFLRDGWFLTDANVAIGMRWRADWLAHVEAMIETEASGRTGWTSASLFAVEAAGVRLGHVRAGLGAMAEQWLVMLLVQDVGIALFAEILYPHLPTAWAEHATFNTFTFVLEQLTERYQWLDRQMVA